MPSILPCLMEHHQQNVCDVLDLKSLFFKTLINFNYKNSQPKYIKSKLEGNLTWGENKNRINCISGLSGLFDNHGSIYFVFPTNFYL